MDASSSEHPWTSAEPAPGRRPDRRPARRLQALLYLLTTLTTFAAGTVGWEPVVLGIDADVAASLPAHWMRGVLYAAAVLAVLTAHEAGHFIAARLHGIPATLPFFLPVPVLITGTLGAVIGMEGSRADRRQLFDIALAGPLAGLLVALPLLAIGMRDGIVTDANPFALPPLAAWASRSRRTPSSWPAGWDCSSPGST
ncbi:MAG: site-2 protease family protein [Planctomycetia bacterium]|nr:site-2 protease family protein [Planctomycetia bacterium]